jgi:transcriptional regulator with XRE-family HTH domain
VKKDSISKRLLKERELLNIKSQAEIAELIGISREMWGKYERGKAMPGTEVLIKLSLVGFDIDYLITGHKKPKLNDDEIHLIEEWRKADFLAKYEALQRLQGIKPSEHTTNQTFESTVKNVAGRDIIDHSGKD